MDWVTDLLTIGGPVAAGMGAIVWLFLAYLTKSREAEERFRSEYVKTLAEAMGNSAMAISKCSEALVKNAEAFGAMQQSTSHFEGTLVRLEKFLDSHHSAFEKMMTESGVHKAARSENIHK